jgi:hypothetical protein
LLTYLTDAAEPAAGQFGPRVGDSVELRVRGGGVEIDAWSATGTRLGRLPPAERAALDELLRRGAGHVRGRISAMVPRPLLLGGGRIHIRVSASDS